MNRKKLTYEQKMAIRRREQKQWSEQLVLDHPQMVMLPKRLSLA